MGTADYSPEKAGVGGSTPSLATISFNGLAARPEILHLWFLTCGLSVHRVWGRHHRGQHL